MEYELRAQTSTKDNPLATCDGCGSFICKSCAGLTASEMAVLKLKERVMLYHCQKCLKNEASFLLHEIIEDLIRSKEKIIKLLEKDLDIQKSKYLMEINRNNEDLQIYADIAKKPQIQINRNLGYIICKPKNNQDFAKTKMDIESKINLKSIAGAISSLKNKGGGCVFIKCDSMSSNGKMKEEIETQLKDSYEIKETQLRHP
ncbi:hypothetical protein HHI36_012987 [Cryptolaemus montrouzieri]|uniref:Uncharacterized protein n=1 Tax=Cryptolaemus montrouzieri TaxID=559131 RepID=A0ABD2NGY9_9CUCU